MEDKLILHSYYRKSIEAGQATADKHDLRKKKRVNHHKTIGKPFSAYSPEFREVALPILEKLMLKHKDELERRRAKSQPAGAQYYGFLVASATLLAKFKLGMLDSKYGLKRYRAAVRWRRWLSNRMGLTQLEPTPDTPNEISYTNMDGI